MPAKFWCKYYNTKTNVVGRTTGVSHSRNEAVPDDDVLLIEVDIQMADCQSNTNGAIQKLSVGNKVASYIFIYDSDVQVTRDGNELPGIILDASVNASSTRYVTNYSQLSPLFVKSTIPEFSSWPEFWVVVPGCWVLNLSCSSVKFRFFFSNKFEIVHKIKSQAIVIMIFLQRSIQCLLFVHSKPSLYVVTVPVLFSFRNLKCKNIIYMYFYCYS